MSGHGASTHYVSVIMVGVAGASSSHGMVVTGVDEAPLSCLQEEGRPEPPSPLEAMKNSLVESSIMALCGAIP
jgi:hypothetical protein